MAKEPVDNPLKIKQTREELLAEWDTLFLTRPPWLDNLEKVGIWWHLEGEKKRRAAAASDDEERLLRDYPPPF